MAEDVPAFDAEMAADSLDVVEVLADAVAPARGARHADATLVEADGSHVRHQSRNGSQVVRTPGASVQQQNGIALTA